MKTSHRLRSVTLIVCDLVMLNLLYQFTFYLRFQNVFYAQPSAALLSEMSPSLYFLMEGVMTAAWLLAGLLFHLYSDTRGDSFSSEALHITRTFVAVAGAVFVTIVFARVGVVPYSRWFLLVFFGLALPAMICWRGVLHLVRLISQESRKVLVIGAGKTGVKFFERINRQPSGYKVIGFLDNNGINSSVRQMILGKLGDLDRVVERHEIDEVVIALPTYSNQTMRELVDQCENLCLRVNIIPGQQFYESPELFNGKMTAVTVGDIPLVRVREEPLDKVVNKALKRTFDIVMSLAVLILVFPFVYLFAALAIKLTSRGPVFYRQDRTGENNKSFRCYKFRSMRLEPGDVDDFVQARPEDPRVTRGGALLRRTNLDEVPQFWNVLKGDMSVVGPRPHPLKLTDDYREMIMQYMVRHFVKPGITGWAQVNGLRGATETPDIMARRVEHDIYYIEHWTFWFDVKIILLTVWKMIVGDVQAY